VTLADLLATLERRAAEADRIKAQAPVAAVLHSVVEELRAVDGTAAEPAAPAGAPDPPAPGRSERYLTPHQVDELLQVHAGYAYDHKRQLGGVKVGKYLRFPESAVRRRLERAW